MPNRKKGHLHPGCRRRGGKASLLLWLLCRSHRTVSSRTLAKLELRGLGHRARGGPAQEELDGGQRGASPRPSAQFAVSGDARGVFLCPWGWWGCELRPGHTGTMCAIPAAGTGKDRLPPARPCSQWLLVPWHSRAAAAATAPHPAQSRCTGHPCSALAVLCWHTVHSCLQAPSSPPTGRDIVVGNSHLSPFRPGPSGHLPATPLGP